jgi:hypothetical protein
MGKRGYGGTAMVRFIFLFGVVCLTGKSRHGDAWMKRMGFNGRTISETKHCHE